MHIQRQADSFAYRMAVYNQELVDRLKSEFDDWWENADIEPWRRSDPHGRGPIGDWKNVESFLRERYPYASTSGDIYMGWEQVGLGRLDRTFSENEMRYERKYPFETGPDAIKAYGYDPREVAASMLLLHNQTHPGRQGPEFTEKDQARLVDIYNKRQQMQRDYEQRAKQAIRLAHNTIRCATVNPYLVDKLNAKFLRWTQGRNLQLDHWPTIERFLKDEYPAVYRGHELGRENAGMLVDYPDKTIHSLGMGDRSPYETGPEAIDRYGYDPAEIAAGMVWLHTKAQSLSGDVPEMDQQRLYDIWNKRKKMQQDYEQRNMVQANTIRCAMDDDYDELYHLTDNPDFTLDPDYIPSTVGEEGGPGIYLTDDPGHWAGTNVDKPYVATFRVPAGYDEMFDPDYGHEGSYFVPHDLFDLIEQVNPRKMASHNTIRCAMPMMYHRTEPEWAKSIYEDKEFGGPNSVWFSDRPTGEGEVYGPAIVQLNIPDEVLKNHGEVEGEFPSGEKHWRVDLDAIKPEYFVDRAIKEARKLLSSNTIRCAYEMFKPSTAPEFFPNVDWEDPGDPSSYDDPVLEELRNAWGPLGFSQRKPWIQQGIEMGPASPDENLSDAQRWLRNMGHEFASRISQSEPTTGYLYRGAEHPQEWVDKILQDRSVSLPLSSFSEDAEYALDYARPDSRPAYTRTKGRPVYFRLAPGAKTMKLFDADESLTHGDFDVVGSHIMTPDELYTPDPDPSGSDMSQILYDYNKVFGNNPPVLIDIKHRSLPKRKLLSSNTIRCAADIPSLTDLWKGFVDWAGGNEEEAFSGLQYWPNVEQYLADQHGLSNNFQYQEDRDAYWDHPLVLQMSKIHAFAQGRENMENLTDSDLLEGAAMGLLKIRKNVDHY